MEGVILFDSRDQQDLKCSKILLLFDISSVDNNDRFCRAPKVSRLACMQANKEVSDVLVRIGPLCFNLWNIHRSRIKG